MEQLDTYRGAKIYMVNPVDLNKSKAQVLPCKVKAEGVLPEPKNFKVYFVKQATDQKQAVSAVKAEIDQYLQKHDLKEFIN